jgi:hypothetical protein
MAQNKRNTKQMSGNKRSGQRLNGRKLALLPLYESPAYRGQYRDLKRIPGVPLQVSTGATANINAVYGVGNFNIGNIYNWSAKFENIFDEYRILGCDMKVVPVTPTVTGPSCFWWDEKNPSIPTGPDAQARVVTHIQHSGIHNPKTISWRARDQLDLQYTPCSVDVLPCYFKIFTSTVVFGTTAVNSLFFILIPTFIVQFRGLQT